MRTKIQGVAVMRYVPAINQKLGEGPGVLLLQLEWMDSQGRAPETVAAVARMMGWTHHKAERALEKLRAAGLVVELSISEAGLEMVWECTPPLAPPQYSGEGEKMAKTAKRGGGEMAKTAMNTPQDMAETAKNMAKTASIIDIENQEDNVRTLSDMLDETAKASQEDKHKSIRAVLEAMRAKGIKLQGGENELRDLVDVLQEPARAKYLGDIAQFVQLHDKAVDNWPAFLTGVVKSWNKKGYSQLPRPKPGQVVNLTGEARAKALAAEKLAAFAKGWHPYRHSLGEYARDAGGVLLKGWFDDPAQSYEWGLAWAAQNLTDGKPSNDLLRHWGAMQEYISANRPDLLTPSSRPSGSALPATPSTERGDNIPVAVAS
jgi:hypothetical protein